ncbi:MAG: nucleoside phosphorylase [Lewinellaceae bacterium]|nr:nucleoside phosphorylase [Lewinellaceae bacterium]
MTRIPESELILNPDGSIYHLNLLPEDLAPAIITVGDPGRVERVSKYFDEIEVKKQKREFVTHTGRIGNKRLTVLSSGIGTENIDIVLNELDALVNIDFDQRAVRPELTSLNIIRIGTSGSLHAGIPVGSFVASAYGLGLDNLLSYYDYKPNLGEAELTDELKQFMALSVDIPFYAAECSVELMKAIGAGMHQGITLTSAGFYGPQGRVLRAGARYDAQRFQQLAGFSFRKTPVTNFEMETSAIYALSRMLGHRALSTNVILANRASQRFSANPREEMEKLIRTVLERVSDSGLFQ